MRKKEGKLRREKGDRVRNKKKRNISCKLHSINPNNKSLITSCNTQLILTLCPLTKHQSLFESIERFFFFVVIIERLSG